MKIKINMKNENKLFFVIFASAFIFVVAYVFYFDTTYPAPILFYTSNKECPICDETKKIICRICKGDGICQICHGQKNCKQNKQDKECSLCKGKGVSLVKKSDGFQGLNTYMGLMYIKCPSDHPCKGDGICIICNGIGKKECPICIK